MPLVFSAFCVGLLAGATPQVQTPEGAREASSEWCGSCHVTQWEQWRTSRHALAATNTLYAANHSQWPMKWCDECHLPQAREDEGVGCAACHIKDATVLTSRSASDAGRRAHAERREPALSTVQACAACHQFNMPDVRSTSRGTWAGEEGTLRFLSVPMQDTIEEWKRWGGSKSCQGCHLPEGSHAMTGAHDLPRLRRALEVKVERLDDARVQVSMIGQRAGHSVPTGDLFRAVRVEVFDAEGAMVARQRFTHFSRGADGRREDQAVPPPPPDGGNSTREFVFAAPGAAS